MPSTSFDNPPPDTTAARSELHWKGRLWMLLWNLVPVFHVLILILSVLLPPWGWLSKIGLFFFLLYFLPPLLGRVLLLRIPGEKSRISLEDPAFLSWWALFQLQVLFCRFPALEEALRLVPGLYSFWLRLWGARIGRLTYWSAGTLMTDRSFLHLGDDVVLGAGVRLNAHVLAKNDAGQMELVLAPVVIGNRSVVGGYSLLTAGTQIAEDEITPAFLISPPFSKWKDGRRVRNPHQDDAVPPGQA